MTTLIRTILFLLPVALFAQPVSVQPPDAARVAELAELVAQGGPVVPVISDRELWDKAAEASYIAEHVSRAEAILDIQPPSSEAWRDAYLAYDRTGDRSQFGKLTTPQIESLRLLTLAEAVENKGRFIPVLEHQMRAICDWPTWVMNAHDAELDNLEGRRIDVDLGSSMLGADLATSLAVLGDRISPKVRKQVIGALQERVLYPFKDAMNGERESMFWMETTNNWNAVCLSGIVVTALAIESPEQAAWYVAGAERLIFNFLSGFSVHGYCSEGMGYWGYGYGHFIVMTEYIRRATGGKVDLFDKPRAQSAALYPFAMEIVDGVYPAFADSSVDTRPNQTWTWYVATRLGLDDELGRLTKHPSAETFHLYGRLLFVDETPLPVLETRPIQFDPLRHLYPNAGVLISRAPGEHAFGMAIKAGHNNEHHNHNDVGSIVVVAEGRPILCDPGSEHYTRDTFSDKRYDSPVHNSYGHSVPVVNGQLQANGRKAAGRIKGKRFDNAYDSVMLDITDAYPVDGLHSLKRAVQLNREDRTITLSDSIRMTEEGSFATAFITYGDFEIDGTVIHVMDGPARADIAVKVQGGTPVFKVRELEAHWKTSSRGDVNPKRLEISLAEPVAFAIIQCTITLPEN